MNEDLIITEPTVIALGNAMQTNKRQSSIVTFLMIVSVVVSLLMRYHGIITFLFVSLCTITQLLYFIPKEKKLQQKFHEAMDKEIEKFLNTLEK